MKKLMICACVMLAIIVVALYAQIGEENTPESTVKPTSTTTKVTSSETQTKAYTYINYCEVDGCYREATKTVTNPFSGEKEHYCKKHYDEMNGNAEKITSSVSHTCGMDGCNKKGTKTWTNFSGIPEYYCSQHYDDLMEALDYFGF